MGKRGNWIKRMLAGGLALALAASLPVRGESLAQGADGTEEAVLFEGGFEEGEEIPWVGKDGAEVSVVSEGAKSGGRCLKVSNRTATNAGAKLQVGDWLREGQRLEISAYVKYEQGPEKKRVQATLFYGGQYYQIGSSELSRGEWGKLTGAVVIPVGTADAEIFFETPWTAAPSAEQDLMDFYLDDVKSVMKPFCDTSGYPSLKELYKHQFYIGAAVPGGAINTPMYSSLIARQFGSMTMENEMKPDFILDEAESKRDLAAHKESAALHFQSCEPMLQYARQNGIAVRGHTLVWHSQTPAWFFYEDYDTSGKLASRELMLKRMENYIKGVISWTEENYPGVIYAWDVANEAVADYFGAGAAPMRQEGSLWYQVIGEDFVAKAFEYARKYTQQYAPGRSIKLFYNDYNEYFPSKRDGIVALLEPIRDAGNIDGVGMQSHIDTKRPLEGADGYMTAVRKFRDELGLEIHVTELDVGIAQGDTEESQGTYYREFMEALLKEKKDGAKITSVTFWGLTDEMSWRPNESCLLFRGDLSRKPAYEGVVEAIGGTGAAIDRMDALGAVELTEACREQIAGAREAYDALTEAQKGLVPAESVKRLEDAAAEYQRLSEEAAGQPDQEEPSAPEEKPDMGKIPIEKASILAIPAQTYTGKKQTPSVKVSYQGKLLSEGKDYEVSYKNNQKIGTASVTVAGKGGYTGTLMGKFTITVKKNKVYAVGNYKYKILSARTDGKGTVALAGVKSGAVKKKLKKINVAAAVSIGGKKFKVVEIGKGALSGCAKATSAAIGENVAKIGAKAFYNCRKLKDITVKTKKLTAKSVGAKAFRGVSPKASIKAPKKKKAAYRKIFGI